MHKTIARAIMVAILLGMLSSCQQLFTTSLGTALARESYDLSDVSLDEALTYLALAQANSDTELASALVAPMLAKASASVVGTATYDQAATALVGAVIISSGIGQAINSGMDLIASSISDGTEITLSDVTGIIESVTISAASVDALVLVAQDPPPSMDAAQAYTAAASLLLSIVANTSLTLESDYSEFEGLTGAQADSFDAALLLYNHATDNLDGADTVFGDFFGALPFSVS